MGVEHLRMTEKRRLATAAAAMRERMTTRSNNLVLSEFTPAARGWESPVMVAEIRLSVESMASK